MRRLARRVAGHPLCHNAAALYGVQCVRKLFPLLTIPFLARTLGPAGWGAVAFTQALAEFLVLAIEFGFNLSATREIARMRDSKAQCGEIMAGVLGCQAMLAVVAVTVGLTVGRAAPMLRDNPRLLAAGLFYAVAQGFVPLWFFQGLERMRLAAVLETAGRVAALGALFLLVRSTQDAWLVLLLQGIAPALTTAAGLVIAYAEIPCRFPNGRMIRETLQRGWPMFVFRSGESLYGILNTFVLGIFASPAQVGYFASAEKVSRAAFGLLNPIRETLYPRLSNLALHSPWKAAKLARIGMLVMIAGGIVLSAGLFASAPLLIRLLMGAAFGPAVLVLRVLALLPVLLSVTYSAGLQWLLPVGRDGDVNRIILSAGVLNVILALLVAPRFAHVGMAWVVVAAETFVCANMLAVALRSTPLFQQQPAEIEEMSSACERAAL